jgi:hypothetical protein
MKRPLVIDGLSEQWEESDGLATVTGCWLTPGGTLVLVAEVDLFSVLVVGPERDELAERIKEITADSPSVKFWQVAKYARRLGLKKLYDGDGASFDRKL